MRLSQEEYDREELASIERKLADVTDPGRQVDPSASGRKYRRVLKEDAAVLRKRLSDLKEA